MDQSIISLQLDTAARSNLDAALDMLDRALADFVMLPKEVRVSAQKMGDRSGFCHLVSDTFHQYPHLAPPDVDMKKWRDDLELLDFLGSRVTRLQQMTARAEDTMMGIGMDVMRGASAGYRMIRDFGKGSGIEDLRRDLAQLLRSRPRAKRATGGAKQREQPAKV